jgi:uncharacterized protein (TIGR03067 family)
MMRTFVLSLAAGLLVFGLVGGLTASGDKKTDDLSKTQGTWTLVSGEMNGQPIPEQIVKNSKLTIVGNVYTVDLGDDGVKKGTQTLDSTKSPKQIDAQDSAGPTVGRNLGIYEFTSNGDFRVCFASTANVRPTEFVSTPENGQFIHVWRRTTEK